MKVFIHDVRSLMPDYPYPALTPKERKINKIIIHSSGTVDQYGVPFGTAKTIFESQLKSMNIPHGCFHYIITKFGKIEYALDEYLTGNNEHLIHYNINNRDNSGIYGHSILICLIGWFDDERKFTDITGSERTIPKVNTSPTTKQINSLINLIGYIRSKYEINVLDIMGHNEIEEIVKYCPGSNLNIGNIRNQIIQAEIKSKYNIIDFEIIPPHKNNSILARFQKLPKDLQFKLKTWSYFLSRVFVVTIFIGFSGYSVWSILNYAGFISFFASTLLCIQIALILLIVPLIWFNPPNTSIMLQHKQKLKKNNQMQEIMYEWVDFDNISPWIVAAVCLSEDPEFIYHSGLDWGAILKAIRNNQTGNHISGGSSISQQFVKNMFLWPNRSVIRKIFEVCLTILVEVILSKKRIIELYLNYAQLGPNIFGVQAGAKYYFNKSISSLSPHEAALLIASLPNPVKYRVDQPSKFLNYQQDELVSDMKSKSRKTLKFFYTQLPQTVINFLIE